MRARPRQQPAAAVFDKPAQGLLYENNSRISDMFKTTLTNNTSMHAMKD
jgi:hypothetical protein